VDVLDVNLESGIASVKVEAESRIDALEKLPKLVESIQKAGFEAEPHLGDAGGLQG
jgi:hypothetical protein